MSEVVIGVDLGGTNVRAGAFYRDGRAAGPDFSQPSRAQEGTDVIIESLAETIQRAVDAAEGPAVAIGLAIPGHVDNTRGVVRWAPNFGHLEDGVFVSWKDVPIRAPLRERISL
ncbi:MAG: ROK family protein, partial [Fimbriimonadaceae bacterium]|nr:ROK family protein [Fimbriimonadaceae bacterium]